MKQYYLYQIDKSGAPKLKMKAHGLNINSFWRGARCWFSSGLYLITSDDGRAKIYRINRK